LNSQWLEPKDSENTMKREMANFRHSEDTMSTDGPDGSSTRELCSLCSHVFSCSLPGLLDWLL